MSSVFTANGVADGTALSNSNIDTAGNYIFDAGDTATVAILSPGTVVAAVDGFNVTAPSGGTGYILYTHAAAAGHVIRAVYKGNSHPTGGTDAIIVERSTTGFAGYVNHYAEGYLRMASGTNGTFTASQTPVFNPTDELVIDKVSVKGTTTSNGRSFYRVTNRSNANWVSTGVNEFFYDTGYTTQTSVDDMSGFRVGETTPAVVHDTVNWKIVQFDDLASVNTSLDPTVAKSHFLAEYTGPTNTPPVANAGSDKTIAIGTSGTLNGIDSDTDGTVTGRAWTLVSSLPSTATAPTLSGANTATLTVTPAAGSGGVHTYRYTATDNAGSSASDTAVVFVPTTPVKAIAIVSTTEWVTVGGGTILANVTDGSDTTGVKSPAGAVVAKSIRFKLAPVSALTSIEFPVRRKLSFTGSGTCTVKLYEGSNVRFTWTLSPTTTIGTDTLTHLNGTGSISSITNWNELEVEFTWTP